MAQLYKNNAAGALSVGLAAIDTSAVLVSGHGARFPVPSGGNYFYATLVGLDSNGVEASWEVVKVTARSTDTLTIVRGQDNTAAAIWAASTRIEMRINAASLEGKQDALVSGTNIKTVNGTSLLGSGNIDVITAEYQYKSTTVQLVSGGSYLLDSTAAPFTATLPSAPVKGETVSLADPAGTWETNNITVNRNGKSIVDPYGDAQAENLILDQSNLEITLYYDGTNWRLI